MKLQDEFPRVGRQVAHDQLEQFQSLQQARERDPRKREAMLHRIQQLTIDRAMYLPIMDYRTLRGVGPRVAEHALDTFNLVPFPAYEDMKMKDR